MLRVPVVLLAALPSAVWAQLPGGTWRTDLTKHSVPLTEFVSAGPKKDAIPSIDRARFTSVSDAAAWLAENEPVISVELNGEARAYPLQILIWHLLVEDRIGDTPILISFSVLCNSAIVFDRRVAGAVYEFGFSGMVRNSNVVLFDRQTESLWQQLTGEAIAGSLTGARLTILASQVAPFNVFRQAHPEGKVLSRDTGSKRGYGTDPYSKYMSSGHPLFPVSLPGPLPFPSTETLVVVQAGDGARAYVTPLLRERRVLESRIGNQPFVIFSTRSMLDALDAPVIADSRNTVAAGVFSPAVDGKTLSFYKRHGVFYDKQTHSTWDLLGLSTSGPMAGKRLKPLPYTVSFAFAWLAFHPDTPVVLAPSPSMPEVGEYLWPMSEMDLPEPRHTSLPATSTSVPAPQPH